MIGKLSKDEQLRAEVQPIFAAVPKQFVVGEAAISTQKHGHAAGSPRSGAQVPSPKSAKVSIVFAADDDECGSVGFGGGSFDDIFAGLGPSLAPTIARSNSHAAAQPAAAAAAQLTAQGPAESTSSAAPVPLVKTTFTGSVSVSSAIGGDMFRCADETCRATFARDVAMKDAKRGEILVGAYAVSKAITAAAECDVKLMPKYSVETAANADAADPKQAELERKKRELRERMQLHSTVAQLYSAAKANGGAAPPRQWEQKTLPCVV